MKRLSYLLALCLCLALIAPASALAAKPAPTPTTPAIAGTVLRGGTAAPISGATVTAYVYNARRATWTVKSSAVTKADGTYTLALAAGTYRLGIVAVGYRTEYFNDKLALADAQSITVVAGSTFTANATLQYGAGTAASPYEVFDLASLDRMRLNQAASYKQVCDIDAAATRLTTGGWTPIGTYEAEFTGTYDGQNFAIDGLYTELPDDTAIGLFATTRGASLRNMNLTNAWMHGYGEVAAIVGRAWNSAVDNCSAQGTFIAEYYESAGIIGEALGTMVITNCSAQLDLSQAYYMASGISGYLGQGGRISDCVSSGTVRSTSNWPTGGIVCQLEGATVVERCASSATVEGPHRVGGIVGNAWSGALISDCAFTGSVSGGTAVGGILGESTGALVRNCYAAAPVAGTSGIGGILGLNSTVTTVGPVISSYYNSEIAGVADNAFGLPKTTAELQNTATFISWDFANVWFEPVLNASYPTLR